MESLNICAYSVRNEKYKNAYLVKTNDKFVEEKHVGSFQCKKNESIISQYSRGPEMEITKNTG
jgi:hypothetical protein